MCEHQQLEQELGLGAFEGRSWTGLHRHALMSCIAFAYLQHLRISAAAGREKKTLSHDGTAEAVASGRALAYGTRLFTDWSSYSGGALPYWGNGDAIMSQKTGKPAGHCMLIIGYNDNSRAVLIQNSEGKVWGIAGYMWMAYSTFQFLAQGQAMFVKD